MRMLKLDNTIHIKIALLFIAVMANYLEAAGCSAPWCDSNVYVKAIGGGKVYATGKSDQQTVANCTQTEGRYTVLSNSHNSQIFPANTYLAAKPDAGWKFVKWECIDQQGTYSTTGATEIGTILTDALPKVQKSGVSKRGGTNTGEDDQATTPCTDINATWYAYFEQVVTQHVKVESGNPSLGTAVIDKNENNTGDEVTITAWCGNSNNSPRSETIMFLGWYKRNETTGEEEFVTRENPYTFTITDSNQGTYVAHFASGYSFWRVKNNRYNNYLTARAKYTGAVNTNPLTLQNALSTQMGFDNDLASALTDAGTMMKIGVTDTQPRTGKEVWDFYVQDEHTNQYYGKEMIADGVFLQVTHQSNNTYIFNGNNNSFYLYENSSGDFSGNTNLLQSGYWQLEGMDKDLTTKENYFTVDPNEFVGPDNNGYYWTTLRVCFNMKYETSEITPFIVSSVDANAGTMELTEVTGGVIPAKSCVLLRCNSKDILRNVMIPTTSNATFSTNGNLLTSSTYYYKDQSVDNSLNLKGIMINDGYIGFGGNTLTQIDGNRAYLSVSSEVSLKPEIPSVTLAELVAEGVVGEKYNVTDLTAVQWVDGNQMLIAKDNNGYATPDAIPEGETWVDYMSQSEASIENDLKDREGITATVPETYDQSNWIALHLAQGKSATTAQLGYAGKRLTGVKGTLLNVTNPELLLEAELGTTDEEAANVEPNVYVAASFNGDNHQTGSNRVVYFFVQPKPMELATVGWAQWDAANEKFVVPANEAHPEWNTAGLSGEFGLNASLMEQGFDMSKLLNGHSYLMPALIKRNAEDYESIYILGNVDGNQFVPNKGVEMYTMDGKTYTATATITEAGQGYGYFSFTKKLASQSDQDGWDEIDTGNYRFGANSNGDFLFKDEYLGQTLNLTTRNAGAKAFKMPTGTYLLTVAGTNVAELKDMTLVVSRIDGSSRAPRRADGTQKNSYIAYPLRLVQTTSVGEGGVITGVTAIGGSRTVAAVDYYNLAGQRSTRPWQGVNIVVTRYTDGTSSTNKQIKN